MAKCALLAFLLCEKATKARDGKITLHGLFDRIITPRTPREARVFCFYYKVLVIEPTMIALRATDPSGQEIPGSWRDSLLEIGPMQAKWPLTSTLFQQSGRYVLELRQEAADSEPLSLASMGLVVEHEGD
jgi:hypothetical protein